MENKYSKLLEDIDVMITNKENGYEIAQSLNDNFWEDLGTHRLRMLEQITKMEEFKDTPSIEEELSNADSIYEAARTYIAKYK